MVRLTDYVELHCHSAFSLLDGASPPEALVARAHTLGYAALALTDHDELGGIVAFAQGARDAGLEGIVGAELTVEVDAPGGGAPWRTHLVLLAEDREGYGNLSMLITRARMERPRGEPAVSLDLLARHARGLFALTGCPRGWVPRLLARGLEHEACEAAAALVDCFGGRVAIECWDHGLERERVLVAPLLRIARALDLTWVVTNDVHYAEPAMRVVHDVLSALRHQRPLAAMGTRLRPNGEWYLKAPAQIARRWQGHPEGVRATRAVAERCAWRMHQLTPTLPKFPLPPGISADEYLARLVEQGAHERWGRARTPAHERQLAHELAIIAKLRLAGYFLIVWDIVRFARRDGVLCQGRGSAANSAVCFCLGITAVDPIRLGLLFERFLSEAREGAPDIDIDFAHRDRERVLQYVYQRYGREHAAMVCEQITYRGRSAVRDACRVLGYSLEQAEELAITADRFSARETGEELGARHSALGTRQEPALGDDERARKAAERLGGYLVTGTEVRTRLRAIEEEEAREQGTGNGEEGPAVPVPCSPFPVPPVDPLAFIVANLHHVPRHRSIHVGGFVLTEEPLGTIVPIEPASMADRTVIQWEKDDVDAMGLVKIDLLGLGMLTLIQDCLLYIRRTRGVTLELADLDCTDQAVYDDLGRADTVGIFQVESRAQMNTLPRLQPRCFYDLVVEVALIRPGPIQGEMVHPYLRRRAGVEPVTYPHPSLEPILKRTLGVPLFQEQGMQVAITAAGFSASEADVLRRAMGHKRSHERMEAIATKMLQGMKRNGFSEDVARRIFNQINAFADYGFPESHAASFALLVYASAYLKHYYAPEYTAAILNAQPMGFYSPGTLIEDARRHGVDIKPIDASASHFETTLEAGEQGTGNGERNPSVPRSPFPVPSVRLGLHLVRGLGSRARERLQGAMSDGPFGSIHDVITRSGLDRRALRALAECGALDCFVPDEPNARRRRAALWRMLDVERGEAGPLAPARITLDVPRPVAAMSAAEITAADYRMTGLSLNGHPMAHLRALLAENGVRSAREVLALPDGTPAVGAAGLVICRQRPGTAKGFVFLTLEDETGLVNVVVTPKRFERQALMISRAPLILVRGTLQVEQGVVNLRGESFHELKPDASLEGWRGHDFH